jgi:hypothetical protein
MIVLDLINRFNFLQIRISAKTVHEPPSERDVNILVDRRGDKKPPCAR